MDTDLTVTVSAEFEGLDDANGTTRTLSEDAVTTIAETIENDLRDYYTDIDEDTELNILAVKAPNVVVVERDACDGGE
jgi:hypothetical protein